MKSIWSIAIISGAALLGIGMGGAVAQSVIGEPILRGENADRGLKLPAGISMTGPSLAARAHEMLGADVSLLTAARQVKNADRIMLQSVSFQRDMRAVYADVAILDMLPGRSLSANLDMYSDDMRRIGSQPLPITSTGSSQAFRITAAAPPQATRFAIRITDASGADVSLFSSSDGVDATASVPPDLPLFAIDSDRVADLLVQLGFASPDAAISGQALRGVLNDFRSLTKIGGNSPFPTLRDLYALRALAGQNEPFDITGYYDWRLSSENLRAPKARAEMPRKNTNVNTTKTVDDVVVEEGVTATISTDDDIYASQSGAQ